MRRNVHVRHLADAQRSWVRPTFRYRGTWQPLCRWLLLLSSSIHYTLPVKFDGGFVIADGQYRVRIVSNSLCRSATHRSAGHDSLRRWPARRVYVCLEILKWNQEWKNCLSPISPKTIA